MSCRLIFIINIFFIFFNSVYLFSAEKLITGSISVKQMYDSNIFMWSKPRKDDLVTVIKPSITLNIKTERSEIKKGITLNILQYANETDLNTVEQNYTFGYRFLGSERFRFGLDASYIRDTTLRTELAETGVGIKRTIRKKYFLSLSIDYDLSLKDTLTITPLYSQTDYQSSLESDYRVTGVILNYKHLLNDSRISLIGQAEYNYVKLKRSDYILTGRYHNWQFYSGIGYLFSETLTMNCLFGMRYTDSKIKQIYFWWIIPYEEKDIGWVTDINLSKQLLRGSLTFGFRKEILPSGRGAQLETNRFYLTFINNFTEKLQTEIRTYYYEGEGTVRIKNYHTWHTTSILRYHLIEPLIVELNYSYTSYTSETSNSKRNTVFVEITWVWK